MTHVIFMFCFVLINMLSFAWKLIIKPGQTISSGPCGSVECYYDGTLIYGDIFCDNVDDQCNVENEPNSCCPPCQVGWIYFLSRTTMHFHHNLSRLTFIKIACRVKERPKVIGLIVLAIIFRRQLGTRSMAQT